MRYILNNYLFNNNNKKMNTQITDKHVNFYVSPTTFLKKVIQHLIDNIDNQNFEEQLDVIDPKTGMEFILVLTNGKLGVELLFDPDNSLNFLTNLLNSSSM